MAGAEGEVATGADARGAARHEQALKAQWGQALGRFKGFLRGTPKQALEAVAAYRDAGVDQLNIALRQGPYDWEALEAFADEVISS